MQASEGLPSVDDVAAAVRIGDERGASALLVGGTASARSALLAAVLAEVGTQGTRPPLVVRVSPPRAGVTRPLLVDEVSAAGENALSSLGAPGGLYDDPAAAGALPSLGGWLFRARQIGRKGVLLVLEELDAWVDARGGSTGANIRGVTEATGAAAVLGALDETTRRQVSLLATVRAADAAGNASLPSELVARFANAARLGPARVVTRDAGVISEALAGRSFSLGALKNALAGWLDLPGEADDVVVVFNAPAPRPERAVPPVSQPAPAGYARDASDTGDEHVPSLEELAPVETRAASPVALHVVREVPANNGANGTPEEQGEQWAGAMRSAIRVRDALRVLRELGAPQGFRQYERAYRDAISHLPIALAGLEQGERALGVEATRLRKEGRAALSRFERAFAEFYGEAFDGWLAGAQRPTMLCDLPSQLGRLAAEQGARGTVVALMTGLRLDAFRRLKETVLPAVPGLALQREGLAWAARPTTPAVQRELLVRGLSALSAALPHRDEPVPARSLEEALRPRREHLGQIEVLRFDAYATELGRTDRELSTVYAAVEQGLAGALGRMCAGLPSRTMVLLAGDVGMREVSIRGTPVRADHARYAYGGDSPFEAVVPYAMLAWNAGQS